MGPRPQAEAQNIEKKTKGHDDSAKLDTRLAAVLIKQCLQNTINLRELMGSIWDTYLTEKTHKVVKEGKAAGTVHMGRVKGGEDIGPPRIHIASGGMEAITEDERVSEETKKFFEEIIDSMDDKKGTVEPKIDIEQMANYVPYFTIKKTYDPKMMRITVMMTDPNWSPGRGRSSDGGRGRPDSRNCWRGRGRGRGGG